MWEMQKDLHSIKLSGHDKGIWARQTFLCRIKVSGKDKIICITKCSKFKSA